MWCGGFNISWQDFTTAVDYATTINIPAIWSNTTSCQRIGQLEVARRSISEVYKQSLLSLLVLYRNFNATDSRDKIYSLLGIADKSEPDAVQIDPKYTIDAREVYRGFTVSILKQGRSLDILGVPRVSKPSLVGELPSWVADWSVSDFAQTFRFQLHSRQYFLQFEATLPGRPFYSRTRGPCRWRNRRSWRSPQPSSRRRINLASKNRPDRGRAKRVEWLGEDLQGSIRLQISKNGRRHPRRILADVVCRTEAQRVRGCKSGISSLGHMCSQNFQFRANVQSVEIYS